MAREVWRNVEGYEKVYQVSSKGRIRSKRKRKIKAQEMSNSGHLRVKLSRAGVAIKYMVHRVVAAAFHPNPENLPVVNHKDGDKTNNNEWNLEWQRRAQTHFMRYMY